MKKKISLVKVKTVSRSYDIIPKTIVLCSGSLNNYKFLFQNKIVSKNLGKFYSEHPQTYIYPNRFIYMHIDIPLPGLHRVIHEHIYISVYILIYMSTFVPLFIN